MKNNKKSKNINKIIGIIITLAVCIGLIIGGRFLVKSNEKAPDISVSAESETSSAETTATVSFTQIDFSSYDNDKEALQSELAEETFSETTETTAAITSENNNQSEELTNIWELFNEGLEEEYME